MLAFDAISSIRYCDNQRDQQSRADRADPRNQTKQFPCLVLLAFQQQIPTYLLAQQT